MSEQTTNNSNLELSLNSGVANNALDKKIEKSNKGIKNQFALLAEKKDKNVLKEQDINLVKSFIGDKDAVKAIQEFSMKEIYKCFKGNGFNGTIQELSDLLNEFGLRKKKPIEWLKNKDNIKKCEDKNQNGDVCGGNVVSMYRFFVMFIGERTYKENPDKFFEKVIKSEFNSKIRYEVNKILEKFNLNKFHVCNSCKTIYEIKKKSGKNIYMKSDIIFDNDITKNVIAKIKDILSKYGFKINIIPEQQKINNNPENKNNNIQQG